MLINYIDLINVIKVNNGYWKFNLKFFLYCIVVYNSFINLYIIINI